MRKFLEATLLKTKEGDVYICSLPNDDTITPREKHILTRDPRAIEKFVAHWDRKGRGLFFCVSTIQSGARRKKENALQTMFLHADIDLKDLDIELGEVLRRLETMEFPPTLVNKSGGGLHAFWQLHEPTSDLDWVEGSLKKIAVVVGGDRMVTHRVALLRLPGSHNTKRDGWVEVETVMDTGKAYSDADIDGWLDSKPEPIIQKKRKATDPADPPPGPSNPFQRYADEVSFKPPVDITKRLAQMEYQGEGDTAIHTTQLTVTASMLAQGHGIDEVVAVVLEATKKKAPKNWNWVQEEAVIRGMCQDWIRKRVKEEAREDKKVVNLAEKRAERAAEKADAEEDKPSKKSSTKKSIVHTVLGNGFIDSLKERDCAMLTVGEQVWFCEEGLWKELQSGEARAMLEREMEVGCRALGVTSTQKIVGEARAWVLRNPEIHKPDVEWDTHGKIATQSGLIDPKTLAVEEAHPDHYVTYRIECEYDPKAKCPKWERMIADCFPGDPNTVKAIQELVGVALLPDKPRTLMRAMVLVGPPNSGKSNILSAIVGFLTDNPNTTPFDLLENTHGTTDFRRNVPWVLHEAFDQSKWHFSAVVKALLSGDPISINIKNGPILQHRFRSSVFWGTNVPPQFKEASKAIENRLEIIRCRMMFDTETVTGIAAEARNAGYSSPAEYILATERSGMLNWAIEGMQRAVARGYLYKTEDMKASSQDLRRDTNLVLGFLEDAIEFDPTMMVSKPDFNAAYQIWWKENRGEANQVPAEDMIGRAMSALYDPRIAIDKHKLKYKNVRYYAGIKLGEMGLDLWTAFYNAAAARGDTARVSSTLAEVNTPIPDDWASKDVIQAMIEAHKKSKGK